VTAERIANALSYRIRIPDLEEKLNDTNIGYGVGILDGLIDSLSLLLARKMGMNHGKPFPCLPRLFQ
jgi:hypothetical protein